MKYTIGQILYYCLTAQDAQGIKDQRENHQQLDGPLTSGRKPRGNPVSEGDEYPLIVTRAWDERSYPPSGAVNGQVLLDGNDSLWVTSVKEAPSHVELKPGFLPGSGTHYDMHPKEPGKFRQTLEDESQA